VGEVRDNLAHPRSREPRDGLSDMSALGHKQTFRIAIAMSALPPESGQVRRNEGCPLWANSRHAYLSLRARSRAPWEQRVGPGRSWL